MYPLWLAPRQVVIVPVSEAFNTYGKEVLDELKKAGLRVTLDDSTDGLNKKVRNAETSHINYILVIGEKEMTERSVAVRNHKTKEQTEMKLTDFVTMVREEIDEKKL